jgi:HlyD family secretion protein
MKQNPVMKGIRFCSKGIISKSVGTNQSPLSKFQKQPTICLFYSSRAPSINEARNNLGRTVIYAPADGTISVLNVELGEERVLGTQQWLLRF